MKHRRRRAHKRNPSTHPILAALAAWLLEGVVTFVLTQIIGAKPGTPNYGAKAGASVLLVSGGGYALGSKLWPQSKTPILVGSVLSAIFSGSSVAFLASKPSITFQVGQSVMVPVTEDAKTGDPIAVAGAPLAAGTIVALPGLSSSSVLVRVRNASGQTWTIPVDEALVQVSTLAKAPGT